jgi:hypothetical protein
MFMPFPIKTSIAELVQSSSTRSFEIVVEAHMLGSLVRPYAVLATLAGENGVPEFSTRFIDSKPHESRIILIRSNSIDDTFIIPNSRCRI